MVHSTDYRTYWVSFNMLVFVIKHSTYSIVFIFVFIRGEQ